MSVNTITNFQSAVNALAPASKNTYSLTYNPVNPNGSYSCQLLKNGVPFLTNLVYGGAQSGSAWDFIGPTDTNPGGAVVTYVSPDNVAVSTDAQFFLNSLT